MVGAHTKVLPSRMTMGAYVTVRKRMLALMLSGSVVGLNRDRNPDPPFRAGGLA